jgi:hypothetical protein
VDCDTCGQHRPSDQIAPLRQPGRELAMACGRCRRLTDRWAHGRRPVDRPQAGRAPIAGSTSL